jgi:hypothetical protein
MLKSGQNCTNCAHSNEAGRPGVKPCMKCSHRFTSHWEERNCDNCQHDAKDPGLPPCCDCKHGLGGYGIGCVDAQVLWDRKQ